MGHKASRRRAKPATPMDHRAVLVRLAEESIFDGDGESGRPIKVAPLTCPLCAPSRYSSRPGGAVAPLGRTCRRGVDRSAHIRQLKQLYWK